jgi:hypothetical protein
MFGGSFPEVKRPGREADHSPPTSAEVKKMWIYTYTDFNCGQTQKGKLTTAELLYKQRKGY